MAKYRGTIRHSDLEGGHFQLQADDGTTYVLEADGVDAGMDGARVEVDGSVDQNAMSFAMTGPVLAAKKIRRL